MSVIDNFHNAYFFLSNFCPVDINFRDRGYSSIEHAYQAAKTLDEVEKTNIRLQPDAAAAKRQGRLATVRDDWEDIKLDVMDELIRNKFGCNPEFKKRLINTFPDKLVEGNHWGDVFWGVCNEKGYNHLGKLLMKERDRSMLTAMYDAGFPSAAIDLVLDASMDMQREWNE